MNFKDFSRLCIQGSLLSVQEAIPQFDLAQTDAHGQTALIKACSKWDIDIALALIPGSPLRHADGNGNTALLLAIARGDDVSSGLQRRHRHRPSSPPR